MRPGGYGRERSSTGKETDMNYRNLGDTGLRVSRVCLGMMSYGKDESREWALDEAAAEPIVRRAVEGGIIFFDTADTYNGGQSEVVTGRLLRKLFGMREEYVLATKVYMQTMPGENGRGLSRKHIMASIDASLERLGLDYVDLYQIHRWDPSTPIAETMEALHDVVKAGKARYIGASSMFAWQFAKAQAVASTRFVSMQNHYNLIYREEEREMIPQCIDQGVGVIPWSPLARGLLAGTRTREGERLTTRAQTDAFADSLYQPEVDFAVIDRLTEVATARGVPSAQIALAWLLHKRGVTAPIVGATKLGQLEDALAAEELSLSAEEIALLEEAYVPHAVAGHQ
jgi:aryl-alcohol dehydrogenase-like predicted oxidoreductase